MSTKKTNSKEIPNSSPSRAKQPEIPQKYYKHGQHPTIRTVGELKACLAELPDDLPVTAGFSRAPQVVVFNHGRADMHLELYENDEDEADLD